MKKPDVDQMFWIMIADRAVRGSPSQSTGGSRPISTLKNVDFNVLSFRSNLVLRWEWRPGSTLYVVWQQDRSDREALGTRVTAGDLLDSFSAPGRNFLAVKASFWLSMN